MMKTTKRFSKLEKAQVLPIVVIAVIAIIIFAALINDGGSIMLNRRTAQASADAGAMAGAREMCYDTGADPLDVAESYALMNEAATADAQYDDGSVCVDATVTNESFFAKYLNEDSLDAGAEATAGCFSPEGMNYVMPIGWSCRPNLVDEEPFDPGLDCKMMALDWPDLLEPLVEGAVPTIEIPGNDGDYEMEDFSVVNVSSREPPKQIYMVMDSIKVDEETFCKEEMDESDPGYDEALTCDLDGDGKYDIEVGGNRGWLDLTGGGGGASDMSDWIINGLDFSISPHTWLSGQPGTVTSVYASFLYETLDGHRLGDIVLIPVYNALCDDSDPISNPTCMEIAHTNPRPPEPPSGDIDMTGPAPTFHVITFNPFYISCVHIFSSDYCPGFALAQQMNPDPSNPSKSLIKDNIPAIEGFFLKNVDLALDTEVHCNVNLGNCGVSLTE